MPGRRHIYLKIEKLPAYSPVAPDDAEHMRFRIDCMRNMGHEDGIIPPAEIERRRLDGVVYREYLDPTYTIPNTAPLAAADVNEPRFDRRIPGALLFAEPGDRLLIHVFNADDVPHSLHVHGLEYGFDSDGSWPFGAQAPDGRRSDRICPGSTWCYVFDATHETVGAWPFHDHHMGISQYIDRGLFGGIVVRDPKAHRADYEVPLFFHHLAARPGAVLFDSGPMDPGDPPFSHTYAAEGTFDYFCQIHPMQGTVRVMTGGGTAAAVSILDSPTPRFQPADVTIGPGGTVTWTHAGTQPHTVTDASGAGLDSYALNGRSFVGNTPTIVAESGKRIRWYVFNLDLGMTWHNFHAHGQRWNLGHETMDTRSLGPAESFVADTVVPRVILPLDRGHSRCEEDELDDDDGGKKHGSHGNGDESHGHHPGSHHDEKEDQEKHPEHGKKDDSHPHMASQDDSKSEDQDHERHPKQRRVRIRGDFLVHCHVEMHMMGGMAALVRAVDEIEVTPDLEDRLGFSLPLDDGTPCPEVDHDMCAGASDGSWESLPDSPIFVVHAAVLRTGKVLLWSGTAEAGYPLESRVWDPATGTMTTQAYGEDLFCSGHAFLADGRLCIAGGAPSGLLRSTHIFDPVAETWTKMADMAFARWYPTLLTLPDGRILAVSGSGASEVEVYDAGANSWQTVTGATRMFPELYPSLHLLPSGQIFYSRAGWNQADTVNTQTGYLSLTGPAAGNWTNLGQQQYYDREEGTAVVQIDATVSPPSTKIMILGGGVYGIPTARNAQSVEMIDVTTLSPPPAWASNPPAPMNFPRTNVNGVLLPDGTILAVGGQRNGKWNPDPQPVLPAEIYDPRTNTWRLTAPMAHPRQYHSIAVLLPDGRALSAGGVDPSPGAPQRDQRYMEIFSPPYLSRGPRPTISASPATIAYGAAFDVDTPDAGMIDSVVLLRPCSMTHHTDAGQRYIKVPITARTPGGLTCQAPANGNVAPPGYYMLFLVNAASVPSIAEFVHVS